MNKFSLGEILISTLLAVLIAIMGFMYVDQRSEANRYREKVDNGEWVSSQDIVDLKQNTLSPMRNSLDSLLERFDMIYEKVYGEILVNYLTKEEISEMIRDTIEDMEIEDIDEDTLIDSISTRIYEIINEERN